MLVGCTTLFLPMSGQNIVPLGLFQPFSTKPSMNASNAPGSAWLSEISNAALHFLAAHPREKPPLRRALASMAEHSRIMPTFLMPPLERKCELPNGLCHSVQNDRVAMQLHADNSLLPLLRTPYRIGQVWTRPMRTTEG